MGKDKIRKFNENLTFSNLVQPEFEEVFHKDHPMKGHWRSDFFHNDNPIVLELGCGRGEYTVALGGKCPQNNYIGVDIKGARIWRGAKTATQLQMPNVGFLRTRIEFIDSLFGVDEVDEIWLTFPDPQLKKRRCDKRLTAPFFLNIYSRFLKRDAVIHLKTDSPFMHHYTKAVCACNSLAIEACNEDIYGSGYADDTLSVKTTYESKFLEQGLPITYLRFRLDGKRDFVQVPDEMLPDCER